MLSVYIVLLGVMMLLHFVGGNRANFMAIIPATTKYMPASAGVLLRILC